MWATWHDDEPVAGRALCARADARGRAPAQPKKEAGRGQVDLSKVAKAVVAAAVLVAGAVAAKRHFGAALWERLTAPRSGVVHACGVVETLCCQSLLRD